MREVCAICEQEIEEWEWEDRHTPSSGGEAHPECCDICAEERVPLVDEDEADRVATKIAGLYAP